MGLLQVHSIDSHEAIDISCSNVCYKTYLFACVGPIDYDDSLALVYLYATTGSKAMVELSITIEEDAIVENDEDFNIMLTTSETRLTIANSTVVIIHDDGESLSNLHSSLDS